MPPWQSRKQSPVHLVDPLDWPKLKGAWLDVGDGECQRCHTMRGLYKPLRLALFVCAPCSQVVTKSCLGETRRQQQMNYDESAQEEAA